MAEGAAPPHWREHYAQERAALGEAGLDLLIARAPSLSLPERGAVLIPHVHLADCGLQVAALANALVASRVREVLAIGPLHRVPGALGEEYAARLRAGTCIGSRFTALHSPDGLAAEEFCWDNLAAFIARAAAGAGRPAPRVHLRSACALPDDPAHAPGMSEARVLLARGAFLVATIDHIHHGIGYGMPASLSRSNVPPETAEWVRERILGALQAASVSDAQDLRARCRADRSDGCDVLLALAQLVPGRWRSELLSLALAPYTHALHAEAPTWVAAALVRIESRAS